MPVRCVAGLGNPGARYEWTRHNAGFWVVDRLARIGRARWTRKSKGEEATSEGAWGTVVLVKPRTFMNASGDAVLDCIGRYGFQPSELLVVVDDVALPAGKLRLRKRGGAGGHRGLMSVEQSTESSDFSRLRVGVGGAEEGADLAEFVLRSLDEAERAFFAQVTVRAAEAVQWVLSEGLDAAMNRFNSEPESI